MTDKVEISDPILAGYTLYYRITNDAGLIYNGSAFVSYSGADIATYALPMTAQPSPGSFVATFPSLADAYYTISIRILAGSVPTSSDIQVGWGRNHWTGNAFEEIAGADALAATLANTISIYSDTQQILATISSGAILVQSPVSVENIVQIVQGDTYSVATSNALRWVIADYTGPDPTGSTLTFALVPASDYDVSASASPTLSIVGDASIDGTDLVMIVEITAAQTSALEPDYPVGCPYYYYQLLLTDTDGRRLTETISTASVIKQVIPLSIPG